LWPPLAVRRYPIQLANPKVAREMRRRLRASIAPIVMAGLTIWASGVTLGELRAEEEEGSLFCFNYPYMCVHYNGECGGFCTKDVFPETETCCWGIYPE
jgi:hypothetical protein